MFRKGDKVICVDDNVNHPEWIISGKIRRGTIYTIRDVESSRYSSFGVRLEEVRQKIHPIIGLEYTFYTFRFRKLWDKKISEEYKIRDKVEA